MEDAQISTSCQSCTGDKGEVEFFCRTCQEPICRNCLLMRHLNITGSNDKISEKERLLDIYERKTIAERTTVNIKEELKLEHEPEKPQEN